MQLIAPLLSCVLGLLSAWNSFSCQGRWISKGILKQTRIMWNFQTLSLEDDANHLFALNQKPTSAHTILDVLKIIKGIAIMPFSPLKDLVALAIAMFELCFTCLLHFVPKNKVHVFACDPSCIFWCFPKKNDTLNLNIDTASKYFSFLLFSKLQKHVQKKKSFLSVSSP